MATFTALHPVAPTFLRGQWPEKWHTAILLDYTRARFDHPWVHILVSLPQGVNGVCTEQMFWWNWGVNFAVAIGTVGAVIVALFGQAFRAKLFPPKLTLGLSSNAGEATRVQTASGPQELARYYHLRVSNARRWSPAKDVHIALLQIEEPGPDGSLHVTWRGDVPVAWRHQRLFPVFRTIGAEVHADLCSVGEG